MEGIYNIDTNQFEVHLNTQKFGNDKTEFRDDERALFFQGYYIDKLNDGSEDSIVPLLLSLLANDPEELPKKVFGTYCIFYHDNKGAYIINDLLSKHSLYYFHNNEIVIFSDSFFGCLTLARKYNVSLTIDSLAIKMMNKHHIFYDDLTYVSEIKFLRPYEFIKINKNGVTVSTVEVPQENSSMDTAYAAKKCHELFSRGTKKEYEKNAAGGFQQILTLSGGMDSRTTFLYGKSTGFGEQKCFCYAEPGSADFSIPVMIAGMEHCSYYYHSIQNGDFILKRDVLAEANEGQFNYAGTTGLYDSLAMYDRTQWGLIHTGLGGGEIMGDLCCADSELGWQSFIKSLECDEKEQERIKAIKNKYRSFNEFANLNDIRRCLNSQKVAKYFDCEYCSPFLYEPFFEFLLTVPYEIKKDRRLYLSWINTYMPTKYPSTFKLGAKNDFTYFVKRVIHHFLVKSGGKTKYDMNPFQYWEKENPGLVEETQAIFEHDMKSISAKDVMMSKIFYHDWNNAGLLERTYILTATWAVCKMYREFDDLINV